MVTCIWADTLNTMRTQRNHPPANVNHRHTNFYLPKPQSQASGISPPNNLILIHDREHIMFSSTRPGWQSEICVCCLLMGRGELWLFCCVHWTTPPTCSLIPTRTKMITHSPSSVSIKHEDTNSISAKATTAHGVMFALALLPLWGMLVRFSWCRTALTDFIHPDTKSGAKTFFVQHISVTLALETNSQLEIILPR